MCARPAGGVIPRADAQVPQAGQLAQEEEELERRERREHDDRAEGRWIAIDDRTKERSREREFDENEGVDLCAPEPVEELVERVTAHKRWPSVH